MLRKLAAASAMALLFPIVTFASESEKALTAAEIASLGRQVAACWSLPAGKWKDASAIVRFELDPDGMLIGTPAIIKSSGNEKLDASARRAILRCGIDGYDLPKHKHEAWQTIEINFDPSQMFR